MVFNIFKGSIGFFLLHFECNFIENGGYIFLLVQIFCVKNFLSTFHIGNFFCAKFIDSELLVEANGAVETHGIAVKIIPIFRMKRRLESQV